MQNILEKEDQGVEGKSIRQTKKWRATISQRRKQANHDRASQSLGKGKATCQAAADETDRSESNKLKTREPW